MAWPCFLVDRLPDHTWRREDTGEVYLSVGAMPPGAMQLLRDFNAGKHANYYRQHLFSEHYIATGLGVRPPIVVWLPGKDWWNVDLKSSNGGGGWRVTGTPPNVSATPSILTTAYHGYLTNGELTDDIDKRTY